MSKRDYENENILTIDGHHEPIIEMELWERVKTRLDERRKIYPRYSRKEQTVEYMLKGLVRCSACGATLAAGGTSGKRKTRSMQCCNYSRGQCHTSHSVTVPKIESAFVRALEEAVGSKCFLITPAERVKAATPDFDKLLAIEERRLQRAKEAYLAEIDSIEQYAKNKEEILAHIAELNALKEKESDPKECDVDALAKRLVEVISFVKRDDISPAAKNEALRAVIDKVEYSKPMEHITVFFKPL